MGVVELSVTWCLLLSSLTSEVVVVVDIVVSIGRMSLSLLWCCGVRMVDCGDSVG